MADTWVRAYQGSGGHALDYVDNLNGVDWCDAPRPRWFHRCKAQTRGRFHGELVERCACGATRLEVSGFTGLGPWINRFERRRG